MNVPIFLPIAESSYINLQNISVCYGDKKVLNEINLSISKGELFTLLGPSASGKTTLLLTIAGFVTPLSASSVWIDGEDISNLAPHKREIGLVFQSFALFPHKSVYDNISYPLYLRRYPEKEIRLRVHRFLKLLDLKGTQWRMPQQLSGGQQQRVALARALVFNPRILLLDEPLGSLDRKLREQLQFEIRNIQKASGSTVIYVTHDQTEALAISDRIGIIRNGRIEQIDIPQELYEKPRTPFVADFLGMTNFLKVKVISLGKNTCAVESSGFRIYGVPRPSWLRAPRFNCSLFVRPEHLRIIQNPKGKNVLVAKMKAIYYLGSWQRLRCILPNGEELDVYSQAGAAKHLLTNSISLKIFPAKTLLFREDAHKQLHVDKFSRKGGN